MVPAHHHEDDSDEELSDDQIRELLDRAEAERHERAQLGLTHPAAASSTFKLPKLDSGLKAENLTTDGTVTRLDQAKLVDDRHRVAANGIKKIEDPLQFKKDKLAAKKSTAGSKWFNLPATELTPEFRRDLQLLKMRNVLDAKRFYKKDSTRGDVPAFSQVGTIIEGPTEFFSSRINNKDRKKTFVEEVLAQEAQNGRFQKKYNEIQKTKTSGKKAFYKALKAKRKGRVEKR
ncbi:Fcf2-domain-containing protein [Aaosphaeria arxii CBS 175.79]|uniref:Fcf2-domain-containing protein n=1 Tax=Aaosphaeria arxii CBS 175.79 TaxID=1450172 RepID=A0A6A5XI62_9PLEO|nr:Fcf2-domain-containing protein [Aaosphaeria arxii CBS 175.79]KAF2012537.1 Fcf2-domain-containing protein [Aaosphaeria arxii CBS 175.79]